jgi:hypothetical protein
MNPTKKFVYVFICAVLFIGLSSIDVRAVDSEHKVGVILMHGKGGDIRWVNPLASSLRSAGIKVETPDMAWHRDRIYDKTFDEAMAEINIHAWFQLISAPFSWRFKDHLLYSS